MNNLTSTVYRPACLRLCRNVLNTVFPYPNITNTLLITRMIIFDCVERSGFSEYCTFTLDGEFTYRQLKVLDELGYTMYEYEKTKRLGVPSGIMSSGWGQWAKGGSTSQEESKQGREDFRNLVRALLKAWGLNYEERELCTFCESMEEEKTCKHGATR